MHELSVVQSLFTLLEQYVTEHQATGVSLLKVKVGKLSGIEPSLLQFAFDTFKKGTIANNAELILTVQDVVIECNSCRNQATLSEFNFQCPACHTTDVKVVAGEEMLLLSVELDVPDHKGAKP